MNQEANQNLESFSYDDKIVRWFTYATLLWGAVAMLLGVTIAFQLAYWKLNMGLEWLTFGRLRPLHTNAAIFAFVGNGMFAGVYYSLQRLCKARLFNDLLSKLHFWGWQLIIVSAAISLPLGMTTGKEYAELEWPIDIAITVVWVIFAVNFFGTLIRRRERHIYVAIWFYIATIVTVAVLHIVNSISIPVSLMKSYSIYAGAQDALIQWWYGHNAVAFFLTTPILGLMYYFVPKAANRPVYSYRLSIVHFWSLVFIYIWAVLTTFFTRPYLSGFRLWGWFSVWPFGHQVGGMINGLLTLRGKWSEVRTNPVLKFLATAVTFYGMSTFEGPLLSVKSVNSVAHFTDWVIGHVHAGTIGWNYMLTAGMLYYLVPKLWKTKIYSIALANFQFWTATIGLFFYIVSMWIAGVTQGMMWRAIDGETGTLVYPNFIETVTQIIPMYWVRAIGGTLVLISFLVMIYNLLKSIAASKSDLKEEIYQAPALSANTATGHRKLEGLPMIFTVLVLLSIIVGTVVEITPTFFANRFFVKSDSITPYTPLELLGRDVFIKEGCYTCHSQMVRPMVSEQLRYGKPSHISESRYDHPFQWGSRRIGPDLARVGSKYPHMWHYRHMLNPRHMTHDSIMPNYPWLARKKIHYDVLEKKMRVMQALGVPYSDSEVASSVEDAQYQANEIADILAQSGVDKSVADKEIVALISYLQRLGSEVAEGITDQEVEE